MDQCFVIQVFDNDKFDKRFKDTFKPAIEAAGLKAYRIDKDPSASVLIDDIERNIKESQICFADITLDSPNVWYELGFAFANGKDVVMICSEEREGSFPFDIQHRQIISYKTASQSDFKSLEADITRKLQAYKEKITRVKKLTASPVVDMKGLQGNEITLLILIAEDQYTDDDSIAISELVRAMEEAGYKKIATNVGVKVLKEKKLIEIFKKIDDRNQREWSACKLTKNGEKWILDNQKKLTFKIEDSNDYPVAPEPENDIPF